MSDTLKDLAIAFFGLMFASGFVQDRAENSIRRELYRHVEGGKIQAVVQPRGLLGLLVGESSVTRVSGRGFAADTFPFMLTPGGGPRARVHHLQFRFDAITLKSLPVRRFNADIPSVSLDANQALWNERIVLRAAGEGTAEVVIEDTGLRAFMARKFPQFTEVEIRLVPGRASVQALMSFFGAPTRVEASGGLAATEGRYIVVVEPQLRLDGQKVPPLLAENLMKTLNPVLDIERDLGLGEFVFLTGVEIGEGMVTVRGKVRIPEKK